MVNVLVVSKVKIDENTTSLIKIKMMTNILLEKWITLYDLKTGFICSVSNLRHMNTILWIFNKILKQTNRMDKYYWGISTFGVRLLYKSIKHKT